ncbi:MAG: adenylate/guanylate cyclase [Myxococcaceae bacterium]|nr:adenylate/guanylate cyclase [Myxococcaceae bacterium]
MVRAQKMSPPAKILVVDDTPQNLKLFKQILTLQGHDVVTASSGPEALEVIQRERPQLVLLDVMMPGMSGYDVCRAIRADAATTTIPVMMVTGLDPAEERPRCNEVGADDVVSKPFNRDDLQARVRTLLRLKALRDTVEEQEHRLAAASRGAPRSHDDVVASMSHELRTPLNLIIGFAELLHGGLVDPTTPEHKEYLGHILSSGRLLLRVIEDLVDLARVEAGTLQLRHEAVAIGGLVAEVCAASRAAADARSIRVEFEEDPALTEVVLDPERFKLALRNALDEAVRMTREGGRVLVRTRALDGERFGVEVEDESAVDGRPRKGEVPALPRRMVEFMGGEAGLRRGPSGGSVVSMVLPRQAMLEPPGDPVG